MSTRPIFLLSPAWCAGRRATWLLRPGSGLPIAGRLRDGTLPLGEAFAFLSGLYFRGKLTYARAFGSDRPGGGALVITPTRGLQPPESPIDDETLREFAGVDVHPDDARYRTPLDRDVDALAAAVPDGTRIVLLGSIATGKYVDVLASRLGDRLFYPVSFVGRGDMSRGGLLLRAAAARVELEYAPLHAGAVRRGPRPPSLAHGSR